MPFCQLAMERHCMNAVGAIYYRVDDSTKNWSRYSLVQDYYGNNTDCTTNINRIGVREVYAWVQLAFPEIIIEKLQCVL